MGSMGNDLSHAIHTFNDAIGFERARMVSRLASNFYLMHKGMHQIEHTMGHMTSNIQKLGKDHIALTTSIGETIVEAEVLISTLETELVEINQMAQLTSKNIGSASIGKVVKVSIEVPEKMHAIHEATASEHDHGHPENQNHHTNSHQKLETLTTPPTSSLILEPQHHKKKAETSFLGHAISFFIPSAEANVREDRVREVKNFYVSNNSQTSDSGDLIGMVFYDYRGEREINVSGEIIKEGYIVFCSPEMLEKYPTFHRALLTHVMGSDVELKDFTISGFARKNGEWKRNSSSLNARNGPNYTKPLEANDLGREMSEYEFKEVIKAAENFLEKQSQTSVLQPF